MHKAENHLSLGTRLIVSREHQTLELLHDYAGTLINPILFRNYRKHQCNSNIQKI